MSFQSVFGSRESQFNTAGGSEFQVRGASVLNDRLENSDVSEATLKSRCYAVYWCTVTNIPQVKCGNPKKNRTDTKFSSATWCTSRQSVMCQTTASLICSHLLPAIHCVHIAIVKQQRPDKTAGRDERSWTERSLSLHHASGIVSIRN